MHSFDKIRLKDLFQTLNELNVSINSLQIRVAVNLTQPDTFLLVDKVTIGAMSPIKSINRSALNPCEIVGNETRLQASSPRGNAQGTVATTTATPPTTETVDEESLNANNTLHKEPAGVSTTTTETTLIRVVRNAVPTVTSTTTTVNGLKCDCSCKCLKADDDETSGD